MEGALDGCVSFVPRRRRQPRGLLSLEKCAYCRRDKQKARTYLPWASFLSPFNLSFSLFHTTQCLGLLESVFNQSGYLFHIPKPVSLGMTEAPSFA